MIDVSDGVAGDLGHICQKSGVSARLEAARLPVRPENRELATAARGDEWHFALHGGEDYELLITRPSGARRAPCAADHRGNRNSGSHHRRGPSPRPAGPAGAAGRKDGAPRRNGMGPLQMK